jgi:8-oxo-dGTP diphosphatase
MPAHPHDRPRVNAAEVRASRGAASALAACPAGKLGVVNARLRHSVRGLVLDEDNCVLLYRFIAPDSGLVVWAPPGGGVQDGESLLQALVRELDEEIGLPLSESPVHVWHQRVEDPDLVDGYDGVINDYYLIRAKHFVPHGSLTDMELAAELVGDFDWWSRFGRAAVNTFATRSSWTGGPALRESPRFFAWLLQIRCMEHNLATRFSPALMPRAGSSSAMNR